MTILNIKSKYDEQEIIKQILKNGLNEEYEKLKFALELTLQKIQIFEKKFNISSEKFLEEYTNNLIQENEDMFTWYSELMLAKKLKDKVKIAESIKI